ncbi:hypothetical protein BDV28DRAFT_44765 [Aspergillus coremiiformis]|uniref:Uncharacterized protein n=1 Tax=Aspergillus coremiiformis TaxID=138285 RepID=A0A5N6YZ35_9EURO|nr:hypothetical protein BDV28DRAFT_44765 [Aspergillus coremiiformis]
MNNKPFLFDPWIGNLFQPFARVTVPKVSERVKWEVDNAVLRMTVSINQSFIFN